MKKSLQGILLASSLALFTGCSSLRSVKNSVGNNISSLKNRVAAHGQPAVLTTNATHSAVATGNYATPQNAKDLAIGSFNYKDIPAQWKLLSIDGTIFGVQTNVYHEKNALDWAMIRPTEGSLDIDPKTKTQGFVPAEYFIPTQTMVGTNVAHRVEIDSSKLKANVTDLASIVNGRDGILDVYKLVDFGLRTYKVGGEDILFFKGMLHGWIFFVF